MSRNIVLLDDSGTTGGAQTLLKRMSESLNALGYTCRVMTTKAVVDADSKYDLIINGTDWKSAGFVYAEDLAAHCNKNLWLLSQINPFAGFVRLYINWESHLFNKITAARKFYRGVVTLNMAHNKVWQELGWNTHYYQRLTSLVAIPSTPEKIIIAANHWDYNRRQDETMAFASKIADAFGVGKVKCVCRSSDTTPLDLNEFNPGTIYVHWTIDDVSPLLIKEASTRGAFVVTNKFPGVEGLQVNRLMVVDNEETADYNYVVESYRNKFYWDQFIGSLWNSNCNQEECCHKSVMTEVLEAAMVSWYPTWEEIGYNAPTKKSKAGGKK